MTHSSRQPINTRTENRNPDMTGGHDLDRSVRRRGIYSVVLEKSDTLRAEGAAIGVHINGWRALDQLGVGMELRKKAILLTKMQAESPDKSTTRVIPCSGEFRFLKRSDLVETLADNLPMNSIRLGCKILAIENDPVSYFPIIHIDDGSVIKAKVLIGCDGSNSVVAKSLGMAGPKLFSMWVIRGFTNYPNGQTFGNYFFRLREGHIVFGRIPVNEKLIHWFVGWPLCLEDSAVKKDSELMRDTTLELLKEFSIDIIEMVKLCDLESLSLTCIRYRAPWDLLLGNLWRGTTTVAGDALHVMGPFISQGGSAGLEDAVVLARCLAPEMNVGQTDKELQIRVETALRGYVKERRLRILRLSTESYLTGLMISSSSWIKKVLIFAILIVLFGSNSLGHTRYDCGRL